MSLMTNPTYICVTLAGGIDGIILSGLAAFLPKYLENQYRLTTAGAAQLFGLMIVPAGGGGTFFGGWLIKKLKLTRTKIVVMVFLTQSITLLTIPAFFLYCDTPLYAGVNTPPPPPPPPPLTTQLHHPPSSPNATQTATAIPTTTPLSAGVTTSCISPPASRGAKAMLKMAPTRTAPVYQMIHHLARGCMRPHIRGAAVL